MWSDEDLFWIVYELSTKVASKEVYCALHGLPKLSVSVDIEKRPSSTEGVTYPHPDAASIITCDMALERHHVGHCTIHPPTVHPTTKAVRWVISFEKTVASLTDLL